MDNLLSLFVGREILVEAEGYSIKGKLIRYEEDYDSKQHIPQILILKSLQGNVMLLRFWNVIKIA